MWAWVSVSASPSEPGLPMGLVLPSGREVALPGRPVDSARPIPPVPSSESRAPQGSLAARPISLWRLLPGSPAQAPQDLCPHHSSGPLVLLCVHLLRLRWIFLLLTSDLISSGCS